MVPPESRIVKDYSKIRYTAEAEISELLPHIKSQPNLKWYLENTVLWDGVYFDGGKSHRNTHGLTSRTNTKL